MRLQKTKQKGRKDEGTNGRKVQAASISSWLACLLLVACSLLPYRSKSKFNSKQKQVKLWHYYLTK
jgi:hypothetical protein